MTGHTKNMRRRTFLQSSLASIGLPGVADWIGSGQAELVPEGSPLADLRDRRVEQDRTLAVLMTDAVDLSSYVDQRESQAERLGNALVDGDADVVSCKFDDPDPIRRHVLFREATPITVVTHSDLPIANLPTYPTQLVDAWVRMDGDRDGIVYFVERDGFESTTYFHRQQPISF